MADSTRPDLECTPASVGDGVAWGFAFSSTGWALIRVSIARPNKLILRLLRVHWRIGLIMNWDWVGDRIKEGFG